MSSNPNPNPSAKPNAGVIMSLINRLRLVGRLILDQRVPFYLKAIPFAPLAYLIFPIDFVPDVLPILGQLDDLGIIVLAFETFIMLCPQEVVQEHQARLAAGGSTPPSTSPKSNPTNKADNIVDGEYRRVK